MHEVILAFPERYDKNHAYKKGDIYPREGFVPPNGRTDELLHGTNRLGNVYLKAVDVVKEERATEKSKAGKKKE